jgi:hypothetical protein
MTTVEDIYSLYERNLTIYSDCTRANKIETCPSQWLNKCYCSSKVPVCPKIIGNSEVQCNIKRKCYIKPGEECPICLEPILTKESGYLTCCGHAFHKKCVFKIVESKWFQSFPCTIHCPMCRKYLGGEIYEMTKRYNVFNETRVNYLDRIEDFWLCKDFYLIVPCSNGYDHAVGMKKGCSQCKKYIETGKYE